MKTPCFQCQDRALHCHESCPRYLEYAAACEELREARYKQNDVIGALLRGASLKKHEKIRKMKGK